MTIFLTGRKTKWSVFHKAEDIDKLIESLNERGMRESELKQNLNDYKSKIIERLAKYSFRKILQASDESQTKSGTHLPLQKRRELQNKKIQHTENGNVHHMTAHDCLEWDLRDKLIEIEEQIFGGSLGHLKVTDRFKWKDALERGTYEPQCASITYSNEMTMNFDAVKKEETPDVVVKDLSCALLQIEQAVERRFLRTPLGDVQKTPERKKAKKGDEQHHHQHESSQTMANWERSLMNATSLSQVFVHLQSLDESIAWSKSSLNARCRLCKKKGDADKMLLCDGCDRGHHMFCLRPVLKVIFGKIAEKVELFLANLRKYLKASGSVPNAGQKRRLKSPERCEKHSKSKSTRMRMMRFKWRSMSLKTIPLILVAIMAKMKGKQIRKFINFIAKKG